MAYKKFSQAPISPSQAQPKSVPQSEMEKMIRDKAQEIYQKNGCQPGSDLANWLEAEKIVKRELQAR